MRFHRSRLSWLVSAWLVLGAARGTAQDWSLTRERRPRAGSHGRPPRPAQGVPHPTQRQAPITAETGTTTPSGRDAALLSRYTALVLAEPHEGFALDRLLAIYRERDGDLSGAVRDFEARLANANERVAAQLILAHIALGRRNPEEAGRRFEAVLAERSEAPEALRGLAAIAEARGDRAGARALYARALDATRAPSERSELERKLGRLAIAAGDFDEARARFAAVTRGGDTYARTEFARALSEAGEHARAVDELERLADATRGDPRAEAPVRLALGREQLAAGDSPGAIATLESARRLARSQPGLVREIDDVRVEAYRDAGILGELVESLSRDASRDPASLALIARLLDETGADDRAIAAYERAIAVSPRDVDLRLGLVRVLGRTGRIDALVAAYRALVALAPREPRYVVELAELLRQAGRADEAAAIAERAGRAAPDDPSVHAALVLLYERWGDRARVRHEVEWLARIAPDDPANLVALGDQRLGDGDREGALRAFERLRSLSSDPVQARLEVGEAMARHGLLEEAEVELRAALLLAPDAIPALQALADVLEAPRAAETPRARASRDDEAEGLLARVLAGASDRDERREARRRLVGITERRGQLPLRIEGWERDFASEPPDVAAGEMLVEAYARVRPPDHASAERVLGRLVALRPGDVETLSALERLRVARGDRAGAIEVLARLVEADPARASVHLGRMAEHALALYRDEDALRYAREAVERAPSDAVAERRLGDLHRARNELGPAAEAYRAVLAADPRQFQTYLDLAAIEGSMAHIDEAAALYLAVLSRCPDEDLVARAGRATLALHVATGRLAELEQTLLPVVLANPRLAVPRRVLVEVYDGLVPVLARASSADGDGAPEARAALARLSGRALFPLLEALADVDPGQRRMAIAVLAVLAPPPAAEPLLALAEHPGPIDLRLRALELAGRIGGPRLLPRFQALLQGDERRLRGLATWALARHAGPSERDALRGLLADPDPMVRIQAIGGLTRLRDEGAVPGLRSLVRDDRHRAVAAIAGRALGRLGDSDAVEILRVRADDPGLAGLGCIAGLAALGTPAARDAVSASLLDPDGDRRRLAASAFGAPLHVGAESDRVAPLGASPEVWVDAVLRADAESASPGRGPAFAAALSMSLASSLAAGEEPARLALAVLEVEIAELDPAARTALLEPLLEAGGRPEPELRRRAVVLLGQIEDERAEAWVAARIADPSPEVAAAALAVRDGPPSPGEEPVLERLASPASPFPVRLAVVGYLGRTRSPFSDRLLVRALVADPFAVVREAAARASAGRDSAREALVGARDRDPEPRVRQAAELALGLSEAQGGGEPMTGNDAEIDDR